MIDDKVKIVDKEGKEFALENTRGQFRDHKNKKDWKTRKIGMIFANAKKSVIPAKPKIEKACLVCGGALLLASGQEGNYHKQCRKYRFKIR